MGVLISMDDIIARHERGSAPPGRRCKIYQCPQVGVNLCCADCRLRRDCVELCLNWPSRCRCTASSPSPGQAGNHNNK